MLDDILYWVLGIFAIVIFLGVFYLAFSNFNSFSESLQTENITNVENFKVTINLINNELPTNSDNIVLVLFIAFIIGMLITTWFLDTNPLMFFIFLFIILGVGIISGYLANLFYDFSSGDEMIGFYSQMPFTVHLMSHYVEYTVAIVLLLTVFYFAKPTRF